MKVRLAGAVARYMASDALSLLGNAVAGVVLPLVLLARTGDVLAAGTLALVCAVPQFVCGLVGGAVLDRVDRRAVCVASDLVSALAVALLPVVDQTVGLSFGWFVALGLLGAVGDVPGMTARDALLPAVCEQDGVDLQRFVGASQSLGSVVSVVGPALAALLMGLVGDVDALWVTAGLSCAAAFVTATLPREVGAVGGGEARGEEGILGSARAVLTDGARTLFGTDSLLRASVLLSFGITMAMGSLQGIVLPAYFTQAGQPQATGYVVSAMGAGLLVGSVVYTACSSSLSRRRWLVVSLVGMAAGMALLGALPGLPLLLAAAAAVGFFAGPAAALLGFFAFDRIPAERRGAGLGTLNALYLVVAPAGAFVGSVLVACVGVGGAARALVVAWFAVTVLALAARPLRDLG